MVDEDKRTRVCVRVLVLLCLPLSFVVALEATRWQLAFA